MDGTYPAIWFRCSANPRGPEDRPWRGYLHRQPPLLLLRHVRIAGTALPDRNVIMEAIPADARPHPDLPTKWMDCYGDLVITDGIATLTLGIPPSTTE
ncbi:hypothetical protein HY632_02395 [Candidatus Uhrbacteria bacterium]|nr:hypothetical protein [Candidatus Uhrbacteria bacterium]